MNRSLFTFLVLMLVVASRISIGQANDFRMENRLFIGNEKEPTLTSTTLFFNGSVYDYLSEPDEVTVFNPTQGRFVLLDMKRRVRTELETDTIDQAIDRIKQRNTNSQKPEVRFMQNPSFDQSIDKETGELVFSSEWMVYRVTGDYLGNTPMVRQYSQFADAYAKLNTFLRPGSRPPFARLIVNKALLERHEIPTQVSLTLPPNKPFGWGRTELRTEHQLIKRLVESDRQRIAQTHEYLTMYKAVTFKEYESRPEEE